MLYRYDHAFAAVDDFQTREHFGRLGGRDRDLTDSHETAASSGRNVYIGDSQEFTEAIGCHPSLLASFGCVR
jgi:hypothetical protein